MTAFEVAHPLARPTISALEHVRADRRVMPCGCDGAVTCAQHLQAMSRAERAQLRRAVPTGGPADRARPDEPATEPATAQPAGAPATPAGDRPDAGGPVSPRRVRVPIAHDIYGNASETVTVTDAEAASHWDARCWRQVP